MAASSEKIAPLRAELNSTLENIRDSLQRLEDALKTIKSVDDVKKHKGICRNLILVGRTLQATYAKSQLSPRIILSPEKVIDDIKEFANGMNGAVSVSLFILKF